MLWRHDPLVQLGNEVDKSLPEYFGKVILVDFNTTAENIGLYLKRFLQLLHARNSHPGSDFACIDPFCSSLSGTIQEIAAYIKMGEEKKESKL